MIVDEATIKVRSGRGGDGCCSFRREKYIPKGGPDGGDGGDGGDVVLVACHDVDTLLDFSGRHHWRADNGRPGMGKQKYGKAGDSLEVRLPVGTIVRNAETGELIIDMVTLGQRHVICKGGAGGKGNMNFATATDQAPDRSTPGGEPEEYTLDLELKLIADIGLVGLPNAGKSTLLSRVSSARPKVADYPFTTLSPQPGIAELLGGRRLVIADIPGLIENASLGEGLGIQFLKHVERTRLLVHLVDGCPPDETDPVANYQTIRKELEAYSPELAGKHEIVVLSKADTLPDEAEQAALAKRLAEAAGQEVKWISSATNTGLSDLLEACWEHLKPDEEEPGWRV